MNSIESAEVKQTKLIVETKVSNSGFLNTISSNILNLIFIEVIISRELKILAFQRVCESCTHTKVVPGSGRQPRYGNVYLGCVKSSMMIFFSCVFWLFVLFVKGGIMFLVFTICICRCMQIWGIEAKKKWWGCAFSFFIATISVPL